MSLFSHFTIPFIIGVLTLFGVIAYKYISWFLALREKQRRLALNSLVSTKSLRAIWEIIRDSLLHIPIFKHNFLLGYMHSSLAFGWFLLIIVGSLEVIHAIGSGTPLYVHIFFKYFHPIAEGRIETIFANIMDILLLIVLSGVTLAFAKRIFKGSMGMKKRSKHTLGDRAALTALWFIFPIRFLAESITSGVYHSGGFVTGWVGEKLSSISFLPALEMPAWWAYSIVLGIFFIAMPFSRYMHIFTEIPHIFLRNWGIRPRCSVNAADNYQIQSCSRCGICIDTCQMQSALGNNKVQAVYFLRNRREGKKNIEATDNCLMCGRCEVKCPVNIDINTLRLSSKHALRGGAIPDSRYAYLNKEIENTNKEERSVGYFAGCMTRLVPSTIVAMEKIFTHLKEDVWYADKDTMVCCGRPLKLSGEIEAAERLVEYNRQLFIKAGIHQLVTSCPICLKSFKEEYRLDELGIEVLHHSQYINRKMRQLNTTKAEYLTVSYHDPCELGRGLGIYDEPREVIKSIATLREGREIRENGVCCGHSLANNRLLNDGKMKINDKAMDNFDCNILITSCPQCKSGFVANKRGIRVKDISELVADNL